MGSAWKTNSPDIFSGDLSLLGKDWFYFFVFVILGDNAAGGEFIFLTRFFWLTMVFVRNRDVSGLNLLVFADFVESLFQTDTFSAKQMVDEILS